MHNSITYVILIIIFSSSRIISQEMYYSSIQPLSDGGVRTVIGNFDLANCNKTELFIDTSYAFTTLEWLDIAICPDGNLYALSHEGIFIIDLVAQTYLNVVAPPYPRWARGLLCTKDSLLIFGEKDLASYNIDNGNLNHYGRLSNSAVLFSNLFFFNGKIMGSSHPNKIIEIDTVNPGNSSVYINIDSSGLLSLTEVVVSCDSVAVFAIFTTGEIYLFNPVDYSLTFYCNLSNNSNEGFQGTHPNFMFIPPDPCRISIDLDFLDETSAGIDYIDTVLCNLPANFLSSLVELHSDKQWDSFKIWINDVSANFVLDGINSNFAQVLGSGTNQIIYTSSGPSDISQLSSLLSDLQLNGTIPSGITNIKIGFATWAKNLKSDTAYAYITIIGKSISAGESGSISFCKNEPPLILSSLISSEADQSGFWIPSTTSYGSFNPIKDQPGNYLYIVNDPYCSPDSATFNIEIYPNPVIDLNDEYSICPGDTVVLELKLDNVLVKWSDGTIGHLHHINEPDMLFVEVIDQFGCKFIDTVSVLFNDDCILKEIYVPNIFSPDHNQINDEWIITADPLILQLEVIIFDRWGNALYHEKSNSINWNGTTNYNKQLPPGIYAYSLWIETVDNNRHHKVGDITLIR